MAQRGAERVGQTVDVLIEEKLGDGQYEGRSAHQAPEVDGTTTVHAARELTPGQIVKATVTGSDGVDLIAAADQATAGTTAAAPAEDPVRLSTARSLADRR
jgi:tRNA A37 methylthiotransferase MiaB